MHIAKFLVCIALTLPSKLICSDTEMMNRIRPLHVGLTVLMAAAVLMVIAGMAMKLSAR